MHRTDDARRRAFLVAALVGVLGPARLAAQPAGKLARIGILGSAGPSAFVPGVKAFRERLAALGWVEGQNLALEARYPTGSYEQLPVLAAELVARPVDVIFAMGSPATQAARKATTTIPIVMETLGDALKSGLVSSLARPAGNLTGVSGFAPELTGKRLELVRELLPGAARIGVIANRSNLAATAVLEVLEATARQLHMAIHVIDIRAAAEIARAFERIARPRSDAVLVVTDPMLASQRGPIVELAARHRTPTMYDSAAWAEAGGLLSYGVHATERFQRVAVYVDRILKGARPSDLPIEQPSTFELALNLRTARALGVSIPPAMRLRADRVIE